MKTLNPYLKGKAWMFVLMLTIAAVQLAGTGCARDKHHHSTSTTYAADSGTAPVSSSTSETTTTIVEEKNDRPDGVISGLFYFVGEVVAFPFKVLAQLF